MATVNGFYKWAVAKRHIAESPIVQRPSRARSRHGRGADGGETPAERRPDVRRDRVSWLTPRMYRTWRDVGLRGYGADGLPDLAFRGARVARNTVYADTMIRTGLRLEEQSSLSLFELPQRDSFHGYYRSWLPGSIAKYESARNIYFPDGVLRDLWTYVDIDRAEAVVRARAAGRYDNIRDPLIIEHPTRPAVRIGQRWIGVDHLDPQQRKRLLIRTRPRPSSNTDQLHERITKLRTENQQLRLHLDLYEEHIRRLTIDNDTLRTELGQTAGVTTINQGNHANRRS